MPPAFMPREGNSDGASVALEGQAMGNGNVLLHGWSLSYDSFWTSTIFYALGSVIVDVRPSLFFAVPAIIATTVILVGVIPPVKVGAVLRKS